MSENEDIIKNIAILHRKNKLVLDQLVGFLDGILADSIISKEERGELSKFPKQFNISDKEPYKTLIPLIDKVTQSEVFPKETLEQIIEIAIEFLAVDTLMAEDTKVAAYFVGMCRGCICDGEISSEEAQRLLEYMIENENLQKLPPFNQFFNMLIHTLEDNHIDKKESQALISTIYDFIEFSDDAKEIILERNGDLSKSLVTEIDPEVTFENSIFCLTGEFRLGGRSLVANHIEKAGGKNISNVTKKLNYLVKGSLGSEAYALGKMGSKELKVLYFREKGLDIKLIEENDLADALMDHGINLNK